jgi:hypothetical protein
MDLLVHQLGRRWRTIVIAVSRKMPGMHGWCDCGVGGPFDWNRCGSDDGCSTGA